MKIKQIALFTLTAVALSGCSAIQAVADAADSALGSLNNALGGRPKNRERAELEAQFQADENARLARSRANQASVDYDYMDRNRIALFNLFSTQLLFSMDANTYGELYNRITELDKAIAAKQQGRATYRPPEFYDQCTAYMSYYMGNIYTGSDCVSSVTLRYTLEERRANYQETIAQYNQDIASLRQQRANLLRFVQQKYGSLQNLQARIAETQRNLSEVTRRLNAHCPAMMRNKPYVELAIKPIVINRKEYDSVPIRADSVFCGRDIMAFYTMIYWGSAEASINPKMPHYSVIRRKSQERTGLQPVDPEDAENHSVLGLFTRR